MCSLLYIHTHKHTNCLLLSGFLFLMNPVTKKKKRNADRHIDDDSILTGNSPRGSNFTFNLSHALIQ